MRYYHKQHCKYTTVDPVVDQSTNTSTTNTSTTNTDINAGRSSFDDFPSNNGNGGNGVDGVDGGSDGDGDFQPQEPMPVAIVKPEAKVVEHL